MPPAGAGGVAEFFLPADDRAGLLARSLVAARWASLPVAVIDDLRLVVTELVSNAVRHGAPAYALRMVDHAGSVEVAVRDRGVAVPVRREASVVDTHGRGLNIIERISIEWGVDRTADGGKYVWAVLSDTP